MPGDVPSVQSLISQGFASKQINSHKHTSNSVCVCVCYTLTHQMSSFCKSPAYFLNHAMLRRTMRRILNVN